MSTGLLISSHLCLMPLEGNTGCSPMLPNSTAHFFCGGVSRVTPTSRFSPIVSPIGEN